MTDWLLQKCSIGIFSTAKKKALIRAITHTVSAGLVKPICAIFNDEHDQRQHSVKLPDYRCTITSGFKCTHMHHKNTQPTCNDISPSPCKWAATSAGVMSRLGGGSGRGRRCSRRLLSFLYSRAANARMLRNKSDAPTAIVTESSVE